ncbi:putative protein-translocating porin PorT [Mucilaginibacter gracilis]|uniref:Outer membrane protein beta-barrel domain-containing protein n=1 Tax=Mucilaginibacter gracilis TaxID=423350 RepID=A0A495J2F8_9SPHI|nr:outer membrane beta-barrel protein [Mucilaginibacter gracilis]RKR82548.1 putative protein-translocating porin PorT [Mucilaginibacter gracilis]
MIKKFYLTLCLLLILSAKLWAQVAAWGGGADYTDYGFGFHFSYISNSYTVLKKSDWRTPFFDNNAGKIITDSLNSITSSSSAGFGVGFIARLRITDNLEVRTTPSLAFSDRTISYQYKTASQNVEKTVNAALVEIPLSLKLKSDRLGNVRAYLLGGVKYSYSITAPKKDDPNMSPLDKLVANQRSYASYEAGVGCDIYFNYFKFSPELKLSNSFKSILTSGNNPYSKPLDKLFLQTLVFSIYFE